MFKKVDARQNLPKMEEEVLKFWEENKIFEKSLENRADCPLYTFYDGPPFATGTPHYGHLVASTMKDIVPRFWTMKGRYVPRKWGWDCHGLPIENIVEKELGSKAKKDIEKLGVDKFNELCRSKVLSYVDVWKKTIKRFGRWADMENSYKTMDLSFMESIWWVFKDLYDKGLIYEGYRSMHICPRCETTLSQSEVAEGYKDVKDLSCIAKFELVDDLTPSPSPSKGEGGKTYILAWTTTPWTLIGNVALAINDKIVYCKVKSQKSKVKSETEKSKLNSNEFYILAKDRLEDIFKDEEYKVINEFKGKDLIGKSYKSIFDYYSKNEELENKENAAPATHSRSEGGRGWKIYAGDFVTTDEGTGIVHIAPAFGEDDMNLGKKESLPFIQHVGMDGIIKKEAGEFADKNIAEMSKDVKNIDVEIIKYLAKNNLLFSKEKYEHSYPHCWRCETPLINYATSSWFVSVEKLKEKLLETAKEINWSPKHIKEGRFGNWLESARDWSISRQRFWASVMPIWKCEKCEEIKVIGSVKELEELSGEKVNDLHKHVVDKITFKCEKCQGEMKRVPDVLDTWFDSGSMPFAQLHYPFENKDKFEKGFPAEFIAEGIDQTRAWFYYLHVISNGIKNKEAFKNVVVNGIVLAEDGKKMSKRLQNYPDPNYVMEKYGADALRFYLTTSTVMQAENMNFKESDLADLVRGMFRMLWNSYSFFTLYANIDGFNSAKKEPKSESLLDKWIISELNVLIRDVNENMENYELTKAARCFPKFIDNLSNWYIRRSRKRFWKSENDDDKNEAYATLHYVLVALAKLMAPFTPFIAEEIYKNLTKEESVHLVDFPVVNEKLIDEKLNEKMNMVRNIISEGLQLRAKEKIKVRQPLLYLETNCEEIELFEDIIKEELNIKEIRFVKQVSKDLSIGNLNIYSESDKLTAEIDITKQIGININLTEDLKLEGQAREVIRFIQEMRKEAGYDIDNRIKVMYNPRSKVFEKFGDIIAKEVLADEIKEGEIPAADLQKELKIENNKVVIFIKK